MVEGITKGAKYMELPKLKHSLPQGKIGYCFLEIVNKEPFRKISKVRAEFMPIVIKDKKERVGTSPAKIGSFEKRISTKNGEEKLFDSEYCRLLDYLLAFDLVSKQGPKQNEQITLTFFGNSLLHGCAKNKVRDIFDVCNKEFLARLYLFIDSYKQWNLIHIIREKGPLTVDSFTSLLLDLKIGFDDKKIERDIIRKREFQDDLKKEWQKTHSSPIPEYKWKKRKIEERARERKKERIKVYTESLMNLYIHVGLIKKEKERFACDTNLVTKLRSKTFWNTSEDIVIEDFFHESYNIYQELRAGKKVITVSIPSLRKKVCEELQIPWQTFDKILTKYPRGYGNFSTTLTRSSSAKRWGLLIQSKPFYFISFKMGGA